MGGRGPVVSGLGSGGPGSVNNRRQVASGPDPTLSDRRGPLDTCSIPLGSRRPTPHP
jgi:hypothetical protein